MKRAGMSGRYYRDHAAHTHCTFSGCNTVSFSADVSLMSALSHAFMSLILRVRIDVIYILPGLVCRAASPPS